MTARRAFKEHEPPFAQPAREHAFISLLALKRAAH